MKDKDSLLFFCAIWVFMILTFTTTTTVAKISSTCGMLIALFAYLNQFGEGV